MVSKRASRLTWLLLLSHLWIVDSWDTDDLELFDLVEEVNKNFYEVIGVEQVNTKTVNCDPQQSQHLSCVMTWIVILPLKGFLISF